MKYAKAIFAALTAGLGSAAVALTDNTITPVEWIVIASAVVAAGGATYGIPNAPAEQVNNAHTGGDHVAS